ncbi:hypothetical protein CFP65_2984 [Kitasatospora sp. MMS16-BH015]|uniref:helicase-associated domain-containing protein n=1 Tax=Kitasatospora sp. MMS16-BH015 TaxID=2018025 RepID=UPI000CA352D3|nr:helicase-associated domain-containing protein [Kitasatospora sp. MMS16-BH015]AUG77794.1 hypothetical protein CFP65_2984 [Kitasatospora sp. MMS16-BH015]
MTAWLGSLTPERLAALAAQRGLPQVPGAAPATPEHLATQLLGANSVLTAMSSLNRPELQTLTAVAALAARLHGPAATDQHGPVGFAGTGPVRRAPAGRAPEPGERLVPRALLLAELGPAAEPVLARLVAQALVLPVAGEQLAVPAVLHRRAAELQGLGRPLAQLLPAAHRAAELRRIARTLGLPDLPQDASDPLADQQTARLLERLIAALGEAERLRRLVAQAPPEAVELLDVLLPGPPRVRVGCFAPDPGTHGKYLLSDGSSVDPGEHWLAARGLLLPVGGGLAELPYEIGAALRGDTPLPFTPTPPAPPTHPLTSRQPGRAQAAAAEAAGRAELLLRTTAAEPPALRRTGGLAVRDAKALAKALATDERETRLWIDLAANAALLAPHRMPDGTLRLLPTERYDAWLAATPAERLVPLLATWAVTPAVFTRSPEGGALATPDDPTAVPLRRSALELLAALPPGRGLAAPSAETTPVHHVRDALAWQQPLLPAPDPAAVAATLAEADLLGLAAEGALTPTGHAVLGLLRAGAARHFPAVPGAGPDLSRHPALAEAVSRLREALTGQLPPPQRTARYQADLTALVAGRPAPALAELLDAVADRESEGQAVVWRFGPASVRRALDAGADPVELVAGLEAVAEGGHRLPQPLAYLIADTARTHGRIRVVETACCLCSTDEALVLELAHSRALAPLGLRRIAPTVLLTAVSAAETLAGLRAAGYAPVLEAGTGTTLVERTPVLRSTSQLPELRP